MDAYMPKFMMRRNHVIGSERVPDSCAAGFGLSFAEMDTVDSVLVLCECNGRAMGVRGGCCCCRTNSLASSRSRVPRACTERERADINVQVASAAERSLDGIERDRQTDRQTDRQRERERERERDGERQSKRPKGGEGEREG